MSGISGLGAFVPPKTKFATPTFGAPQQAQGFQPPSFQAPQQAQGFNPPTFNAPQQAQGFQPPSFQAPQQAQSGFNPPTFNASQQTPQSGFTPPGLPTGFKLPGQKPAAIPKAPVTAAAPKNDEHERLMKGLTAAQDRNTEAIKELTQAVVGILTTLNGYTSHHAGSSDGIRDGIGQIVELLQRNVVQQQPVQVEDVSEEQQEQQEQIEEPTHHFREESGGST